MDNRRLMAFVAHPSQLMRMLNLLLRLVGLIALGALSSSAPAADATRPPVAEYGKLPRPSRDGIGKVYFGREISHVMGHLGAGWLERPEREQEERTDLLLQALALKPGEVVADIGAGSGYFSWRMARQVGETGAIYGVEIQQEMLDLLMANMRRRKVDTIVRPILGTVQDPKLPEGSVDTILLVDVYHELEFPYEMTQAMIRALKPGGRLVLVEYKGEDPEVPIKLLHKMTVAQVRKEVGAHPIKYERTLSTLPWQHIIVFRKAQP